MRVLKYRAAEGKKYAKRHARNAERVTMHVVKGDTVRVMRGEDKGKEGKILRVYPKTGRVVVEGVNIVKRHRKARRADEQSGIIDFPAPIHASNVMVVCPQCHKATRIGHHVDAVAGGKTRRTRVCRKCGATLDRK